MSNDTQTQTVRLSDEQIRDLEVACKTRSRDIGQTAVALKRSGVPTDDPDYVAIRAEADRYAELGRYFWRKARR